MHTVSFLLFVVSLTVSQTETSAGPVHAIHKGSEVEVYAFNKLFTVYKTGNTLKYPYFFPVNGPATGRSVTTESSEPYPHHHSLFFGCDRVNSGNFWQDDLTAGQIQSVNLRLLHHEGTFVSIENECEWRIGDNPPLLRDQRLIVISAPTENLRVIDFELTAIPQEVLRIEKTNHSLFAARMAPGLSVVAGGTLVNAQGDKNEEGTFGKSSPWCDYSGIHQGVTEGLAIFQHPENPLSPWPWFTRDYGFFSPTLLYWPTNGSHSTLEKNEAITLRFRVVVHVGDAQQAGIESLYNHYSSSREKSECQNLVGNTTDMN